MRPVVFWVFFIIIIASCLFLNGCKVNVDEITLRLHCKQLQRIRYKREKVI